MPPSSPQPVVPPRVDPHVAASRPSPGCPLCEGDTGDVVWRDARLRVVLPDEPDFPGFTRVIWDAHVAEMTDLATAERDRMMRVVWAVEAAQRRVLVPVKVNLASLGNMVPHLHWHVVPRWPQDTRFPGSPWSAPRDGADAHAARALHDEVRARLPLYRDALAEALAALPPD